MKRKTQCIHIDEELVRLANNLVASITNAHWHAPLCGPTPHMCEAMENYRRYKRENNVEAI